MGMLEVKYWDIEILRYLVVVADCPDQRQLITANHQILFTQDRIR